MSMSKQFILVITVSLLILVLLQVSAFAAFVSGSTGVDGVFAPSANTVVQIPESGVLNFTTITIPSGVTITFAKNSQNTPVTILASGDVTVTGSISVNGMTGSSNIHGAGGPGGFDGGAGGITQAIGHRGEGPGTGDGGKLYASTYGASAGSGGSFGVVGSAGGQGSNSAATAAGTTYGNERILPLIGGSGGSGGGGTISYVGGGGGGGGGAILIASSGKITVNGSITANGGAGGVESNNAYGSGGGGGSGGAIRLIANTFAGSGAISANGGSGGYSSYCGIGGAGGVGRIRVETAINQWSTLTSPPISFSFTASEVTPTNMPTLFITSIGGVSVPALPKGAFSAPDVVLPYNTQNPVSVVVTGTNIPAGSTVTVKSIPPIGTPLSATGVLSNDAIPTTSVALNLVNAYPSLLTASVTFELIASNGTPVYVEGERVDKVRVSTNMGGRSNVIYITSSGREIPVIM